MRRLLTPKEVADYLAVNERTIRNALRRGELRGFKVLGKWRVKPSDVEDWLEAQSNDREIGIGRRELRASPKRPYHQLV